MNWYGETKYKQNLLSERKYLKFPVRLIPPSRCEVKPKVGHFCIEPVYEKRAFTVVNTFYAYFKPNIKSHSVKNKLNIKKHRNTKKFTLIITFI